MMLKSQSSIGVVVALFSVASLALAAAEVMAGIFMFTASSCCSCPLIVDRTNHILTGISKLCRVAAADGYCFMQCTFHLIDAHDGAHIKFRWVRISVIDS
jgi:hypothetical protein